ncbi:MAG TPA: hypothetical protein VHB50_24070 [Bryobacteraceae bacterium]|nr:hypothetical protein [Bryobacteraceae bacterium]
MFRTALVTAALAAMILLSGCGTSTPNGSKVQTMTGVSPDSGYPAGNPRDAESPSLSSSTEQQHSHPGPKVPVTESETPKPK